MNNLEKVLDFIARRNGDRVTNRDIVRGTGVRPHQQVFQLTQTLLRAGRVRGLQIGKEWQFWVDPERSATDDDTGKILSESAGLSKASSKQVVTPTELHPALRKNHDVDALSEDEIKVVLVEWLSAAGWKSSVAWGNKPGIDIDARRGDERWIIEVKGPGSRPQMRVNYFLGLLGETLQRMDDAAAEYSVAFPDLPQFRRLWNRLPNLAKRRTGISAIFVRKTGEVVVAD